VASDAPAWALALLREARVGRLATADADGRPLVVPVCYALDADGQRLYSAIDAKPKRTRQLRRLRNIRENPQVSVVVDQYDEDWTRLCYVIVEGRAEIVEAGPLRERAIAREVSAVSGVGTGRRRWARHRHRRRADRRLALRLSDPLDHLAETFRRFAERECGGSSPLYEALALTTADDAELGRSPERRPPANLSPISSSPPCTTSCWPARATVSRSSIRP